MKTTNVFSARILSFAVLCLMMLTSTAFPNKEAPPLSNEEEFIYLLAYPGTHNDSRNYYISGIIQYNGYTECSKDYITKHDLFGEAGQKFLNYLASEYSLNKKDWKLQYIGSGYANAVDYPSGYFEGFKTKSEVQNAKDSFIRSKTNDGVYKIYDTDFKYKCFAANGSPGMINTQQSSTIGKAWWLSYYIKNTAVYITQPYNNDCNHCDNEISTAFVKWLILNDYDHQASTVHVINLHDVKESSLDERREEKILSYKQKGYSVINVNFSYSEN